MPYLFLGDSYAAKTQKTLQERNVKYVGNVAKDAVIPEIFYTNLGIDRLWIKASDTTTYPLKDDIPEVVAAIEVAKSHFGETGNTIFIHCVAGVSRSATFVIAALMWVVSCIYGHPTNTLNRYIESWLSRMHWFWPNKSGHPYYPTKVQLSLSLQSYSMRLGFLKILLKVEKELYGMNSIPKGALELHEDVYS